MTWSEIAIATVVVILIGTLGFFATDCIGTKSVGCGIGTVTDKHHREAWTQTEVNVDTNGQSRVSTTYHPAEYTIYVSFEYNTYSRRVTSGTYNGLQLGDRVQMWENYGRLTGLRYVTIGEKANGGGW